MVRTRTDRENERRQLRTDITELERVLGSLSYRLERLELEEEEAEATDVEVQQPPPVRQIQVGDRVVSRNPPYHNGKVIVFSEDGYWVYIRNVKGHQKRKALHNVELA